MTEIQCRNTRQRALEIALLLDGAWDSILSSSLLQLTLFKKKKCLFLNECHCSERSCTATSQEFIFTLRNAEVNESDCSPSLLQFSQLLDSSSPSCPHPPHKAVHSLSAWTRSGRPQRRSVICSQPAANQS